MIGVMNKKRFRTNFDVSIYDSETEEYISVSDRGLEEIAKRMNEQQATNDYLEEANSRLQIQLGKTLRLVDEQQTTISALKEENKRLHYQIIDLQDKLGMSEKVIDDD